MSSVIEDTQPIADSPPTKSKLIFVLGAAILILVIALVIVTMMSFSKTDTHDGYGAEVSGNRIPLDDPARQEWDDVQSIADQEQIVTFPAPAPGPAGKPEPFDNFASQTFEGANDPIEMIPVKEVPRHLEAQRLISEDEKIIVAQINDLMKSISTINDELRSGTLKDVQLANKVNSAVSQLERANSDLAAIKTASSKLATQVRDHNLRLIDLERSVLALSAEGSLPKKAESKPAIHQPQQASETTNSRQAPKGQFELPKSSQEPAVPIEGFKVVATTTGSALLMKDQVEYVIQEGLSYKGFGKVTSVNTEKNTVLVVDDSGRNRIVH